MQKAEKQEFKCVNCKWRKNSEESPSSLKGRLWKWHTGWCPGWKAYQKHLNEMKK